MSSRIHLSSPHMCGKELEYVQEAFGSNWIAPAGPNIDAFENELSMYTGIRYAAALSSGTAALHLALVILGVQKDDIVLCQSMTFCASANPIVYQGAIPVFIDSEPNTWNICPDALEHAIKHYIKLGKKPKAVIGVHLYGMPAMLNEIVSLCRTYEIPFIEDAAEALGSEYKGQKLGSFGDMSVLSFNGNKIITTSGGGALLSSNELYVQKAKFLATQARDPAIHYQHSQTGYNYRMSNVCAGIGRGQMHVLNIRKDQRRKHFEFYYRQLESLPGISFQPESDLSVSNRWLTALVLDEAISGICKKAIIANLENENIESRPLWKPMHLQPLFSCAPYIGGKVAENLFMKGLCLPSGSSLSENELVRVTESIKYVFSKA